MSVYRSLDSGVWSPNIHSLRTFLAVETILLQPVYSTPKMAFLNPLYPFLTKFTPSSFLRYLLCCYVVVTRYHCSLTVELLLLCLRYCI